MNAAAPARPWSPWRTLIAFGFVSLCADMVYEGMRSVAGPFLGSLGASALTVGVITGAGEAIALTLRLVSGRWADRRDQHWRLTIVGYALTAVCVPLLAVTPFVGGAGLFLASALMLTERTGKAVRSPSKSVLLAGMTVSVGRGRGFGVHKALDQVGAFSGPLVIAAVVALTGHLWLAFALLAVPGALSLVLLASLRQRMPEVDAAPLRASTAASPDLPALPRRFHLFAASCALCTVGLMTFGVISFSMVDKDLVGLAATPLVYAGAMALGAVAALAAGVVYDRYGAHVLLVVPVLVAAVPPLAFASSLAPVLVGIAAWALAMGVQDSTVKALVADLVPKQSLGTAYGVFAAGMGGAALAGGTLAGLLYDRHVGILTTVVALCQLAALVLLWQTLRPRRQ